MAARRLWFPPDCPTRAPPAEGHARGRVDDVGSPGALLAGRQVLQAARRRQEALQPASDATGGACILSASRTAADAPPARTWHRWPMYPNTCLVSRKKKFTTNVADAVAHTPCAERRARAPTRDCPCASARGCTDGRTDGAGLRGHVHALAARVSAISGLLQMCGYSRLRAALLFSVRARAYALERARSRFSPASNDSCEPRLEALAAIGGRRAR